MSLRQRKSLHMFAKGSYAWIVAETQAELADR